jgi:hypothetical protein
MLLKKSLPFCICFLFSKINAQNFELGKVSVEELNNEYIQRLLQWLRYYLKGKQFKYDEKDSMHFMMSDQN